MRKKRARNNESVYIHPVRPVGRRRRRIVTRYEDTARFYKRGGGGGGSAVWGKLKMSIKSIRKRGSTKAKIAVEHCSAKGQFIFVCYINFLLRLLSSTSSSSSSSSSSPLLKNLRVSLLLLFKHRLRFNPPPFLPMLRSVLSRFIP